VTDPAIYVAGAEPYFIARIPAVPGCNASGKTRDEAIANVRRAFADGEPGRPLLLAVTRGSTHWVTTLEK